MFQTVIDGNLKLPARFSMDDGFVGLARKSPAKLSRARSGSSIPYDAGQMAVSLGEASTDIHERRRNSRDTHQTSHTVTDNEATTLSEEKDDATSRSGSQPQLKRPIRRERPCFRRCSDVKLGVECEI